MVPYSISHSTSLTVEVHKVEDQLHRPARELVKVRVAQKHRHQGDYQAIDNYCCVYSPMWWSGGGSEPKNYMREAPSWNKISDRPAALEMDRRRDMSPAHKPADRMLEKFMVEFTDRLAAIEARITNRFDAMEARLGNRFDALSVKLET